MGPHDCRGRFVISCKTKMAHKQTVRQIDTRTNRTNASKRALTTAELRMRGQAARLRTYDTLPLPFKFVSFSILDVFSIDTVFSVIATCDSTACELSRTRWRKKGEGGRGRGG